MSTSYKLTYFDGRGAAETIRLVLTVAGVPFEDIRVQYNESEWPAVKSTLNLPFGQLPLFEFGDVRMCQSVTIARYLARKYNLVGKTDLEQARADMIVDCIEDTVKPVSSIFHEHDPAKKEELRKKYIEEQLPAFLDKLEVLLVANNGGNGYFVGDSLTWADLHLLRAYGCWELMLGLQAPLSTHVKLSELYQRVVSEPNVAAYMSKLPTSAF